MSSANPVAQALRALAGPLLGSDSDPQERYRPSPRRRAALRRRTDRTLSRYGIPGGLSDDPSRLAPAIGGVAEESVMALADLQSPIRAPVKASGGPVRGRYKRPFDFAVLALALVGLLPLWILLALVVAVAIRLDSPGPVLYRQPRLGRGGTVFGIVKLRTMRHGAEAGTGPVLARPGDRRLTAVGRVLRRWHVDELPQAWNILRGEMSLVGPRPERPELAARIEREVPGFSRRLAARPGVMGLAQWRGGYRLAPRWKLRYDQLYLRRMGPWLDLRLAVLCVARGMAKTRPSRPYRRRLARGRRVDYLLIAGPGRSGSTYLFEGLAARGDFVAPAIKEGAYYRVPGRLRRAVARLPAGAVLLDGANAAWRDPRLAAVTRLHGRDCRVLLVRGQVEWARSMKAFRASRGEGLGWRGEAALERRVVGNSLSPADVTRPLGLGVDVLRVEFAALVRDPAAVLDRIAGLCGRPPGGLCPPDTAVNPSVAAQSRAMAAAGKCVAVALRALGWLLLLRRLKASVGLRRRCSSRRSARPEQVVLGPPEWLGNAFLVGDGGAQRLRSGNLPTSS